GQFDLHQTQMATELRLESIEAQRDRHWLVGLFADRVTNDGSEAFAIDPILKVISFDEGETELAVVGQATRYFSNGFNVTFGLSAFVSEVARVTPTVEITIFQTPSTPTIIRAGNSNNLLFTEFSANKIASITTDGVVTESPEFFGSGPTGITAGVFSAYCPLTAPLHGRETRA